MRILSITAGAAGMYCGSCFRDNALAAELLRQGHDVTLVPLYTPTLTDEQNVSQKKIFFGGISVYLEQTLGVFRKTPWFLDRLWDAPWMLKLASRRSIPTSPRLLAELTISVLKGEQGFQKKEIEKLLHWLQTQPPFEVVDIPHALLISLASPLKKALRCPVVCTLQGEDLFLEGLPEPWRGTAFGLIRANLEFVDAFVAVSEYYADFASSYLGIARGRIRVVPIGINMEGHNPEGRKRKAEGGERRSFTIGYLARIAPEKGLYLLCDAYKRLRSRPGFTSARLEVAGYLGAENRGYLQELERQMEGWGLGREFRYRGVLSRQEKIRFLQGLDVLSVPSSYADPKGTYLLEAMANGVPVVQPRRGAFPEIIEKTGGGIIVEPERPDSLADGIYSLWKDPELAERLSRSGAAGVREHYSAARMAERALEVYEAVRKAALQPA